MLPLADLLRTKNLTGNTGNTGNAGDADQDGVITLYPRRPRLQEIHRRGEPGIGAPPLRGQKTDRAAPGPLTLDHTQEEARWVLEQFPPGDPDREALEELTQEAATGDPDGLLRLAVRLVEVYGRRIDPHYRAAIWGGRTWSEVNSEQTFTSTGRNWQSWFKP